VCAAAPSIPASRPRKGLSKRSTAYADGEHGSQEDEELRLKAAARFGGGEQFMAQERIRSLLQLISFERQLSFFDHTKPARPQPAKLQAWSKPSTQIGGQRVWPKECHYRALFWTLETRCRPSRAHFCGALGSKAFILWFSEYGWRPEPESHNCSNILKFHKVC
jgi:hypothetical protein